MTTLRCHAGRCTAAPLFRCAPSLTPCALESCQAVVHSHFRTCTISAKVPEGDALTQKISEVQDRVSTSFSESPLPAEDGPLLQRLGN